MTQRSEATIETSFFCFYSIFFSMFVVKNKLGNLFLTHGYWELCDSCITPMRVRISLVNGL